MTNIASQLKDTRDQVARLAISAQRQRPKPMAAQPTAAVPSRSMPNFHRHAECRVKTKGDCSPTNSRLSLTATGFARRKIAMCKKCNDLEQKIAYYTRLTSRVIDHELTNVLEDILRKLQSKKARYTRKEKKGCLARRPPASSRLQATHTSKAGHVIAPDQC